MRTMFDGEKAGFSVFSNDEKISLKRVLAAVEWIDDSGILNRFESSRADAVTVNENKNSRIFSFCKNNLIELEWIITEEKNALSIVLTAKNSSENTIKIKKLEPLFIDRPQGGDLIFEKGLPHTRILTFQRLCGDIQPRYLWEELYQYENFSSEMILCLCDKTAKSALNIGFISAKEMFGKIEFSFNGFRKLNTFSASCDAEGLSLAPGEKLSSEKLFVNIDDSGVDGLRSWAERTKLEMNNEIKSRPVIGWGTWDYYFGDISEESILENADYLVKHRKDIPVEYIQIDAGYTVEKLYEWENWNEDFPHGPKWLVDKIKEKGFKAGLWLVPFWANVDSFLAKEHRDWLVKDDSGEPFMPVDNFFSLDGSHPEVQEYLRKLAQKITKEWGFEYIKIDGASMIGMTKGLHWDPKATSCQAYRKGIEAFRGGMEDGVIFMGGLFGPAVGLVDSMRIGSDVGARWDSSKIDVHAGERDRYHGCGNVKRAISSTLNSSFMHKRLWINDSDYLVVRDDRSELSLNEARSWASLTGLYGGTVILSDRMETLSEKRLEILKKVFPICSDLDIEVVDFLKKDIPEILFADIKTECCDWKIVALFNYSEIKSLKTFSFSEIGLTDKAECHVFGFWASKYHGTFMNSVSVPVEAHACEILAIRKDVKVPQVLGTDIHITCGLMELDSSDFSENALTIRTKDLGKSGNIFVLVPDGFEPEEGLEHFEGNVWKSKIEFNGKEFKTIFS